MEADVSGLSHEGRGIAQVNGKAVFVHGALPGERVRFRYTRVHRRFDEAVTDEVIEASPERVEPACAAYGVCGGCSLQHMHGDRQIEFKQTVLLELLQRFGEVQPEATLPPLRDSQWGYRRKARLAVRHVAGKGRVLVGFRERHSPYVADMVRCEVLDPAVGHRLDDLSGLIGALSIPNRIPQIEVAIGDDQVALVFRNLEPLSEDDLERLGAWGRERDVQVYQQPGNESTITPVWPAEPTLHYDVEGVGIRFRPGDFTQVNAGINRKMVRRAQELLCPGTDDRILDLFCGLGNFSLPLALIAGHVIGVEGSSDLVERARANAQANGIANAEFHVANLTHSIEQSTWSVGPFEHVLLDPPRSGAAEILPAVAALRPAKILYVSCNPATLARDAGELVHRHGYRLREAGVMDMFPQTAHVESIALFQR